MADYHAVLQRTLSGFSDPKAQLRTKLYERARKTIARQLEGRQPAMLPDDIIFEMTKLENAITQIEQSYDADYVPAEAPSAGNIDQIEEVPQEPIEPEPDNTEKTATEADPAVGVDSPVDQIPEEYAVADMVPPMETVLSGAEEQQTQVTEDEVVDPVAAFAEEFGDGEQVATQLPDATTFPDIADAEELVADPAPIFEDQTIPADISGPAEEIIAAAGATGPEYDVPPIPISPAPDLQSQSFETADELAIPQPMELPAFDPAAADDLNIPPAPGFDAPIAPKRKKRSLFKTLMTLILLGGIAAAGYYGFENKEQLIERFDLGQYLNPNDPTRPKPVKTIAIAPPPAIEQEDVVAPQQDTEPKVENRLTSNGDEVDTAVTLPPSVPSSELTPNAETLTPTQPSTEAAAGIGTAILYEKDNADGRAANNGSVTWSIVQEEPAAGEPKEPAIRGRVEIPERDMVLIMTIKRNADKGLPATHLIELVFAVPDNFSGGSIGQISRVVFKDSEQSRGESLLGVPAPIASGIFLFALNNLDEAREKNVSLMKSQDWIDIPLQYATGRSALITIEKGDEGKKVFEQAFSAWDSAS